MILNICIGIYLSVILTVNLYFTYKLMCTLNWQYDSLPDVEYTDEPSEEYIDNPYESKQYIDKLFLDGHECNDLPPDFYGQSEVEVITKYDELEQERRFYGR